MKDLTHVLRPSLPWRDDHVTECGLDAMRHPTWSRDEAMRRAKDLGQQRFALFVCMTCWSTAQRHATWQENPASCLHRYTEKLSHGYGDPADRRRFADELRALALLVEAHRAEFQALRAELGDVVSLSGRAGAARRVSR